MALTLDDLFPVKTPVTTSIGTLYVRTIYSSDWKHIESADSIERGRLVIKQACSRSEDRKNKDPLQDEDLSNLTEHDYKLLAVEISKRNKYQKWEELPNGSSLKEIGDEALAAQHRLIEFYKKSQEETLRKMEESYRFLPESTMGALKNQVTDVGNYRKSASIYKNSDQLFSDSVSLQNIRIPTFEESPAGKALLRSAQHSQQSSERLEDLVQRIGDLQLTIVTEVLPRWKNQIDDAQISTERSFDQARKSLRWTTAAVWTSIIVAFATTAIQIWYSSRPDETRNSQHQELISLLKTQIENQNMLIEKQHNEFKSIQESLNKKSISTK